MELHNILDVTYGKIYDFDDDSFDQFDAYQSKGKAMSSSKNMAKAQIRSWGKSSAT